MEIKSNIQDLIAKFKKLADDAEKVDFSKALEAGVNAALGQMKQRVFNTGKDSKGIAFGKYVGKKSRATNRRYKIIKFGDDEETAKEKKRLQKRLKKNASGNETYTEYEKERLARGRQIKYKDLEMTGGLRRGIVVVVESQTRVSAQIINPQLKLIAEGQEKQISRILNTPVKIWALSEDEKKLLDENTNSAIQEIYARIFNS